MCARIIPEFSYCKPQRPFLRTRVNEATKEGLQTLVDVLGLAVRLRVVRSRHTELCIREQEQLLPEGTHEDLVAV
jgi:hypothetical protein